MINRKTIFKTAAAVSIVLVCNLSLVAAGNIQPGSPEDPVITLSYFTQEVSKLKTELSSIKTELGKTKTELDTAKTELSAIKEDLKNGNAGNTKPSETKPGETKPPETKPSETKPGETTKPNEPATLGTAVVTAQILNVRDGAGTSFKKVGTVALNNKITLLEKKGDWYKIKYGSLTGWIHGAYIKK